MPENIGEKEAALEDDAIRTLTPSIRDKVWDLADSYYPRDDWAHGRSHIERVVRMGLEIGRQEGANLDVIELAAILHDIFEYKESHGEPEGFRHEIEGAKEARRILQRLALPEPLIDSVAHCIAAHRKRTGTAPETIEAKCLFDADKLDCLGAVGVLRCAFVSFDHGQEVYKDVEDIEVYKRENLRPDGTIIDYSRHSSNLEWELSLKHVPARMFTEAGKKLAVERAEFMKRFYERLAEEIHGKL